MTGPGPITVFCPNDDAFVELAQKLGTTKMDLMSHQALPNIVKHHVVQGAVTLADMSEGKVFTTMGGTQLKCSGGKVNGMSEGVPLAEEGTSTQMPPAWGRASLGNPGAP